MTHWGVGARLLSCASMLVLAGAAWAHPSSSSCQSITHPTTINHDKKCVTVKKTIYGDVVNNATVGKHQNYHHDEKPGFFIGDGGLIKGKLVNNGGIFGGEKGMGALTLGDDADVKGGIFNNGVIASDDGSGISLGYYEHGWHGGPEAANLTGDIVNDGFIYGDDYGIAARYGTMSGALINTDDGVIIGDKVGVYVADSFTAWTGGIENAGLIYGDTSGIQIGGGHGEWGGEGGEHGGEGGEYSAFTFGDDDGVVFSGGISNTGAIISKAGPSIAIGGASFGGGVYNDGLITQYPGYGGEGDGYGHYGDYNHSPYEGVGVVFTAETVEGGLFNDVNGEIYGTKGPAVWITNKTDSFSGGITNLGIIAGSNDGIRIESAAFSGGLYNSGEIVASYGDAIFASSAWSGDFANHGLISGAQNGFAYVGSTFDGDFGNVGVIEGGNVAVLMSGQTFDGAFTNMGAISGGATGVSLNFANITGGFTNGGSISGAWGDGVVITVGTWGAADARADIVNAGSITGADTGFLLNAGTVYGDFINNGQITGNGENTGVHIIADAFYGDIVNNEAIDAPYDALVADIDTFDGSFVNAGDIAGGANGAVLIVGEMTGDFTNSGSISGYWGNGADITVDTWGSTEAPVAIANEVGAVISGGATGFALNAGTLHGSFTNEGLIQGGTTGASLAADIFDAPFLNSGEITGGVDGVVMVLGSASGGFSNSGAISGEWGDGVSISVGTWGAADARADIVNTATGAITGGETGFALNAGTVYGDFINDGQISGAGENTGVHIVAGTFDGDIVNNESITSPYDALFADIDTFDGSFTNTDSIAGGANGAVFVLGQMTGDFTNSGSISGEWANGVDISVYAWGSAEAPVEISNAAGGVISGGVTGFAIDAGTVHGAITNQGTIEGGSTGFALTADALHGSFTNESTIQGGTTGASFVVETFDAPFANSGAINGGVDGVVMALGTASGGLTNSGSIAGEYGDGVDIVVAAWGSTEARADIINTAGGTITGGANGFSVGLITMHGDIDNDGAISGGNIAVLVSGGAFDGAFTNTGDIDGGATGVAFNLETVTGAFTNSGSIDGVSGDGVAINVGTWGAADARADLVNTATGVIAGGDTGFLLDAGTVYGDFVNDGQISGQGENTGVHIIAGEFVGDIVNNESISSPYDALVADIDTFDGSFSNTDSISGGVNGAVLILGEMTGDVTNSGSISGTTGNGLDIAVGTWGSTAAPVAIANTVDGVITGGVTGFALYAGDVHGTFTNDGSIQGGTTGASFVVETFDAPFANSGGIAGGVDGVVMALGSASGGFSNSGSIGGTSGDGVDIVVAAWGSAEARADIVNTADGTITGGANGFSLDLVTMHGDIDNDGAISGGDIAVLVSGGTFDGAFTNTNDIDGGATGVAFDLETVTGAFTNSGSIDGVSGDGVALTVDTWGAADARADIVNTATGVIAGGDTGFLLDAGTVYGDFINDGQISGQGSDTGVHIIAGTFVGDVENNNAIGSPYDALVVEAGLLDGSFANTGSITGGDSGAVFQLGEMTGDFTNSNSITGAVVDGVAITVETWGSTIAPVAITNTVDGVMSGGATGFVLSAGSLHGSFTNAGVIQGGTTGASFAVETFDAPFANSNGIAGGVDGVAMVLGTASGGFSNSGSIVGTSGNGVDILVTTWGSAEAQADIVNTASGVIVGGDTGFLIDAGAVFGDFVNNGQITGGGDTTGLHIIAGTFAGDVLNTNSITAASNAMHLEIELLDGEVVNSGNITATAPGGVAAQFAIGNGATFTNTGGGLIIGDVVFGGDAAYHFVAEDGVIQGNLIGEDGEDGNDDTITVQNGTHVFTGGTASNFASFTVAGGATAMMGALFEGDPAGGGYAFGNVDNLTVNNGGTLYIDKSTTLVVDNNFTTQAGATVEFYLGAPGGADFEDLTGNVVAGEGDYGRIIVTGSASLNGSVVGFLDPAFADANPNLVEVLYDDVIVAEGGIIGDFQTVALIADSSLFELSEIIDGNAVDMRVTRTSIDIGDLPGIIVNTGGPFDAMVSDRSNGLGSGSCGLASASDGWCFNRFAANEPGASQVMTDASPQDPFAWLRTGVRKEGETAVWGRAIGAFGDTNGHAGSKGTDFRVVGAIAGIDHNFSPTFMAGLAGQWTTTDVDFKGRPDNADVESFEAGAYMSIGDTRLYLNANASVIWHEIDVNRFSPTGQAFGEYDGTTYSVFAEAGKTFETPEVRIQPFLALSFSHLDTNGYSETGSGTRLNVSDSTFDSFKSIVGARVAYPIALESGRKVVPEFRLAWAHEFMDDQASFVATIQGQQPVPSVVRGEKFSRDTAVVGAGVTVPLSDSSSLFIDYDGGFNSDITTHTVSAGVRFTW